MREVFLVILHRGRRLKVSPQESANSTDSYYCTDAADTIEDIFLSAGWDLTSKTDRFYLPGYSIHEVGTCRMGDDPKRSVLNKWCQSHDHKNLFVVDGASRYPRACSRAVPT